MERTYVKSKSGATILVRETEYDALGLPVNNRLGVIRPKEGSDLDLIINALEGGEVEFEFSEVQNKDNGIYEMVRNNSVPVGELAHEA